MDYPDQHHLRAAIGWLELGNPTEANEELDQISPSLRSDPDVLELRWAILASAKKWEACLETGNVLVQLAPDRPTAWKHRSVALHFLKRTQEAYEQMSPAIDKFPQDWVIRYDFACYCAQLGKLEEARAQLQKASELGDAGKVKSMALEDPDLEPLWAEIRAPKKNLGQD
ncbi:tetratricopeptide repeat protein [Pedosphaera parvula]|uniref:tetratricopeptide repeat protein n=1 Tax=Pedosphaera parvula TaxID=1032527 RepID=UPI001ED9783F|nr:tetratricopeptide repeat protein [Pedosphaera parvula]